MAEFDVTAACSGCGIDTLPYLPHLPHSSQWYMVTDEVWQSAGGTGYMCVDCLESRLGRPLVAQDLADMPINIPGTFDDTPRLYELKLKWMSAFLKSAGANR